MGRADASGGEPPSTEARAPRPVRRLGDPQPVPVPSACYLTAFDPLYAPMIASWTQSDLELIWLAPSTVPPLTARKVVSWSADRDRRFLFWNGMQDAPIAYSELNSMPGRPQTLWIGHFLLDPAHRGRSHGTQFARALLSLAFTVHAATEVLLVVFPENVAAIQCYRRAGWIALGRERKHFETTGRDHVFLRMGIDRTRYHKLVADGQLSDTPLPYYRDPPPRRSSARPAVSRT